ncbi:MAG: hypothetical protein WAZ77_18595 [Candidatus Nitrosopolaris sp.]
MYPRGGAGAAPSSKCTAPIQSTLSSITAKFDSIILIRSRSCDVKHPEVAKQRLQVLCQPPNVERRERRNERGKDYIK